MTTKGMATVQIFLIFALAGVAQLIERWPIKQRVTSSIPSQGTCLGCGPDPQQVVHERQSHLDGSLPPFSSVYE